MTELAKRFFTSHGPATLRDFTGWSGLTVSDARAGIRSSGSALLQEVIDGNTCWAAPETSAPAEDPLCACLLPGFDEYILGYKDRSASLDPKHAQKICPGSNGMFSPTIVLNGRVAGTWKRTIRKNKVTISLSPFTSFSKTERTAVLTAAKRYGTFMGGEVNCVS